MRRVCRCGQSEAEVFRTCGSVLVITVVGAGSYTGLAHIGVAPRCPATCRFDDGFLCTRPYRFSCCRCMSTCSCRCMST